jgi:tetratricopeptide (TPR) repeat protein
MEAKPTQPATDAATTREALSPDALSDRRLDALAAGNLTEAEKNFRAAIAFDDEHMEAHHGLVRALRDAGRLEQAIGAALRLTALAPSDPVAHAALSIALQQAGHIPEAEAAAARARILEWKQQLSAPTGKDEIA